jgi:hypothetical protein
MSGLPLPVLLLCENAAATTSRADLIALGYEPSQVDWWLRSGAFEQCELGQWRLAGSEPTLKQQLATRLWRAGPGARIAGPLRLAVAGLSGFVLDDQWDHIAVPPGRRVRGVDFRVVRTPLPAEDHDRVLDLPAVTVARGLIGASATAASARIRVAHDDAKRRKLIADGEFAERAGALGRAYGAPQARRIAGGRTLRMESEPERNLFSVFRPGDPVPDEQVWVCWRGRWFRLDFGFRAARLALEYDGEDHAERREEDADRDLALAELHVQTLRITKTMMVDPADVRRRILAVYEHRMTLGLAPLPVVEPPWPT